MVAQRDTIYADAIGHYRFLGNVELVDLTEALAYEAADIAGLYDGCPVASILVGERYRAALDEMRRRQRLHAAGADVADPNAAAYEAWADLAGQVRQQADIIKVFADHGYHLKQTGREEWHGWCFSCRDGRDRLMVRTDPPGRYWCRVCGTTGDSITALRSLSGASFREAVRRLAEELGMQVPSDRVRTRPQIVVRRNGREEVLA